MTDLAARDCGWVEKHRFRDEGSIAIRTELMAGEQLARVALLAPERASPRYRQRAVRRMSRRSPHDPAHGVPNQIHWT